MSAIHPPISSGDARPLPASRLRHGVPLAAWALVVLALHGLLLASWPAASGAGAAPATRALSVRQIVAAPPPPAAAIPPAAQPARQAPRLQAPPVAPGQAPPPAPAGEGRAEPEVGPAAVAMAPAEPASTRQAEPLPEPASDEPQLLRTAALAEPPPTPAGEPPPVYRTRLPPAAELQYELRRGAVTGEGLLRWQRSGEGYELTMEGSVFGFQVLSQVSRGGFDLAGLAPQRFVDRRRGRDLRAANFQRDRGVVTYSGSSAQHPLLAGAQDRLSWMVQMAAIIDADPVRFRAGEQVEMAVSGSRGDTDVWTFTVTGREAVELAGARLDRALVLKREPRKPYDTRVEVWLDPGRHHLPVRIRLSSDRGAEAMDFVLRP